MSQNRIVRVVIDIECFGPERPEVGDAIDHVLDDGAPQDVIVAALREQGYDVESVRAVTELPP